MDFCNKSGIKRIIAAAASALFAVCLFAFLPVKAQADSSYDISLEDLDDCLTAYEEDKLEAIMQTSADKIKCNIGIVITADLEGRTGKGFADKYSDDKFGKDSDSIVLLLLNRHDKPEYKDATVYRDWISTDGRARDLYDDHIDGILDKTYRGLDNDFPGGEPEHKYEVYTTTNYGEGYFNTDSVQFYMAGKYFCKALVSYKNPISRFFNNVVYFFASYPLFAVIMLIIPIFIMAGAVKSTVSKYTKKAPISASQYIDKSHFKVKREVDRFVREYTTSVTVSSSSRGGGHGGGHHGGGGHGGGGGRGR